MSTWQPSRLFPVCEAFQANRALFTLNHLTTWQRLHEVWVSGRLLITLALSLLLWRKERKEKVWRLLLRWWALKIDVEVELRGAEVESLRLLMLLLVWNLASE